MSTPAPPRRSAFFFHGRLDPPELANFNLQNIFLHDRNAVLEVLGHGIAIWWPHRPPQNFDDLRDAALRRRDRPPSPEPVRAGRAAASPAATSKRSKPPASSTMPGKRSTS
jgi:hypothetical protein